MLIGLTGQAGSGKDTIYERAKLKYPNAQRIAFADKLKDSAAALLDVPVDNLNLWKNNSEARLRVEVRNSPTDPVRRRVVDMDFRTFLQRYGTESHRDIFGYDFWVEQALANVPRQQGLSPEESLTFVTDVRFENEVEAVWRRNGQIWRIHGPNDKAVVDHVSEQTLPDAMVDVEIDNTRRDDNFKSLDAMLGLLFATYQIPVTGG
jgi:hypothetical protein